MLDRLQVPERPIARDEDYSAALRAMAAHTALTWRGRAARLMVRLGLGRPPQLPNTYSELHFHFDPNFFNQGPKLRLYGYFQSELYFAPIADTIRRLFQPREPLGPAAEEIARQIAGATLPVSVHVRRGDYLKASVGSVHGILEAGYYARALRLMAGALGADMTLFVFSDDPAAAEAVIATVPGHRTVIVRGDPDRPWEDMALMARCRHHIVANSSFSWWGAWLNPSADKVVIGPRLWFAPEALRRYNLCDLCPPGWILI
jgi:hypothetical protein